MPEKSMNSDMFIQVDGRTYTSEDLAAGKHEDDPSITEPDGSVVNVSRGAVVGIQAGAIYGGVTFS